MKGNGYLRINIILFVFFIFFVFSQNGFAEDKKWVEIRLSTSTLIESLPGKTISGNYLVINNTEREEEFYEEIRLPEGWSLAIQEDAFFSIEAGEKEIRVFGIFIPVNTPPGLNEITISVSSRKDPSIKDEKTFIISVLPLYKINLSIEERPDKVVTGLTYTIKARAFNHGNLKTMVSLIPKFHPEFPFKVEPSSSLEIEAGSSQVFSIHVRTDEKINRKTIQVISIKALVEGIEEKVLSEQSFSVEIIPRMVGKEDPYHRIPSTLSVKGFYDSNNKKRHSSGQIEFTGAGTLDEEGEKRIAFKFRGPENKYGTFFNKDEYMLNFSTKGFNTHIGDGYYSLSPLLGPSVKQRGIKAGYNFYKFTTKAFLAEAKEKYDKIENSLGGSLGYRFIETGEIKLNFLRNDLKETRRDYLLSLLSDVSLEKKLRIGLEGALSREKEEENEHAWRIHLAGEPIERLRFFFTNYHAEPGFCGSITPGDYISGGINVPIYDKISLDFTISKMRENFRIKPEDNRTTENDELSFTGGILWQLPSQWGLSLHYRVFDIEDRLRPINYDYKDELLRFGVGKNLIYQTISTYFNAYVEGGKTKDRLNSQDKSLINFGFSGSLRISPRQTYTFFINHGRDYYENEDRKTTNIGVMGSWKPLNSLSLDLGYFLNQRNFEKDTYLRHNFRFRASYLLPNNHSIELGTTRVTSRNGDTSELSVYLGYTIPLGIPISKKKSVGTIKGIIYDEEDPQKRPLRDVILMASGIPAVTDKDGKFVFPGLKPGEYYLQIERGSIGHEKTTSEKIEPIKVKGGELSKIDIGILRSGKISGKIELYVPKKEFITEESLLPEDFIPHGGLSDVLVEISRKGEVLRQFTDGRGEFVFEDIRPGTWKVKIFEESLPAYHVLKEKEFEIEVKPSEEKKLKFNVFKKPRKIIFEEQ